MITMNLLVTSQIKSVVYSDLCKELGVGVVNLLVEHNIIHLRPIGAMLVIAYGFCHEHCVYRLTFNSISKTYSRSPCNKFSQMRVKCDQSDQRYWVDNPGVKYLAFIGDIHCASITKLV